jgi:bla regulator protein blaR1
MLRALFAVGLMILPAAGFQNIGISDSGPSKRVIKMTKPVYPPDAKAGGIQGLVRLDVVVGKDGTVKEIRNAAGRPELIPAAADAVKNWIYEPVLKDGQAVEFIVTVDVNFSLQKEATPARAASRAPIEIRGSVQEGKLVNKVRPVYPPDAKAAGLQGSVKLVVVVAENGMLGEIRSVTGPLPLIQSAVDAVRQWTWKPTTLDGAPVPVMTEIMVNFRLAQ